MIEFDKRPFTANVLQDYLDRYQNEWSEIIQALVEMLGELTAKYVGLSPEEQAQRLYLAKAVVTIREHLQNWLPPGLDQGGAVMSVDACKDWVGNVAAHIEELQSIGAAVLIDSMIQATEKG